MKNVKTYLNGEKIATWFWIFWKSNDLFLFLKWSIILFHIYFSYFVQNLKPKKDLLWHVYLNVFYYVVTFWKITWIFVYDECFNLFFGEDSFIFNFVTYEMVTKSPRVGCIFQKARGEKQNVFKSFYNQIRMNHLT